MSNVKNTNNIFPINSLIQQRWSSRSFDSNKSIPQEEINSLIEAARWAPSSFNDQPWRFLIAKKGDARFDAISNSLFEFNQMWATDAPVYIMVAGAKNREDGTPNAAYVYDCGQAVAYLTIEGTQRNIMMHQMGGFDKTKLHQDLKLNDDVDVLVVIAVGYYHDNEQLKEPIKSLELTERVRKSQQEILL